MLTPPRNIGEYGYSNANYMLLGLVIEKKTEKKYHEYLRGEILDPLNLTRTFLSGKETITTGMAYSWGPDGKNLKDISRNGIESVAWAAGSIFSSVEDLTVWYDALFGGEVINQSSLDEMMTTVARQDDADYGSGIFKENYKGNEIFLHGGKTIAYNSTVFYNKNTKDIVVVIVNQIENDSDDMAYKLLDKLN